VIVPNRWRYVVIVIVCIVYAFWQALTGPTWYRAEAVLAFKNRDTKEQLNLTRITSNPLPVILDEAPVEQAYELTNIIYSVNMANRVLGDRMEEIYNAGDYNGVTDFYVKFLSQLGYEYDGDSNIVNLTYTYRDPELAAEFCNAFALNLEEFMIEVVERTHVSGRLRSRLDTARIEAGVAEEEVRRIAELYGVPNLIEGPKEWVQAYAQAVERSYSSETKLRAILGALMQIRENRNRRNLLAEPTVPPDTTIIQDAIIAGLRLRLAMVNASMDLIEETEVPGGTARAKLEDESAFLRNLIGQQYESGIEVETRTLMMQLDEQIVKNYLHEARAEVTYERLSSLPSLEAEIRPYIRTANVANATVASLERITALLEIGEGYGVHPIMVIESAEAPEKPIMPVWNTLMHMVPIMLLVGTIWFAFTTVMIEESSKAVGKPVKVREERQ